jgi:isopentenyl-diphosphate delta-isomerase
VTEELVVLLDPRGRSVGTAPKAGVHHASTPLHLAFSLYVFNDHGELLVTRRALGKATFPGLWTNSVCGHPAPGEAVDAAARRRAEQELGLPLGPLRLLLPQFAYRAEMHGVVEHELCPVLAGWVGSGTVPAPAPGEVEQTRWVPWAVLVDEVRSGGLALSPWAAEQVERLTRLGPEPEAWAPADPVLLPPAARLELG